MGEKEGLAISFTCGQHEKQCVCNGDDNMQFSSFGQPIIN